MKIAKNAISQEQINQWKAEHGHVYRSVIGDTTIIWRRLKRGEYVDLMMKTDNTDGDSSDNDIVAERLYARQDALAKMVMLYPSGEEAEKIIKESAGLSTTLSEQVLKVSGFSLTETGEL